MTTQTRLFVGGVPGDAALDALRESFGEFGSVIGCDLKSKPSDPDNQFAFITLDAGQLAVDACIRHFSQSEWHGTLLHVTRARESFLERLQKERAQASSKKAVPESTASRAPVNFEVNVKPRIPEVRNLKIRNPAEFKNNGFHDSKTERLPSKIETNYSKDKFGKTSFYDENYINRNGDLPKNEKFTDVKKISSDNKRLESMRKMRKEFNEKKLVIKTGLAGVDKASNKKIKFNDDDEPVAEMIYAVPDSGKLKSERAGKTLFDDGEDDDDEGQVNFQIKEQFEGRKGQKVLELQSRFKSDKRFTLDERFKEDEDESAMDVQEGDDQIQVLEADEKAKQLNILQNVLGHAIRSSHTQPELLGDRKKTKAKMGMLRFDPNHPDHAKFLAPSDSLKKVVDNNKKKKTKRKDETAQSEQNVDKVEVSKEQFYKVSETLKEAIAQPNSFSLRSLFSKDHQPEDEESRDQFTGFTPLDVPKKEKMKNPMDKGEKNPFKYDSSDSEPEADEGDQLKTQEAPQDGKPKAVWREKLFFTRFDNRFKEGLAFFNNIEANANKERRELRVLMKKRLSNRSRKDTMFQKKIGGKRKNFNKNHSRKQKR